MKKKILTMVTLSFLILLVLQVNAQKDNEILEVREIAISQLQNTLDQMPYGEEQSYGFTKRSEFENAEVTDVVCESIGHDSNIEFNRYRLLVAVNGEARAMLSYKKEGTGWIMCGFGAVNLAREVSILKNSYKSSSSVIKLVRINDKSFKGDFVNFDSSVKGIPQEDLIPLTSSKEALYFKNIKTKSTYTLQEVMQLGLDD